MKSIIVGTAGHIDHGKTALVKALTGIDADRLEEEKRRGITIDLGFAHMELNGASGEKLRVGFVDVPGHERFVRNMLAGVGGIDLVLLVIAADESIKPQTREHFDILQLLGVKRGITVLTKSDAVDADTLEVVRLEVEDFLRGTFLESPKSPIVPVSSLTGTGLDDLKRAILAVAAEVQARDSHALARLPIDRVFTMKGFGTVVTGTLISGTIRKEDELEIFPDQRRVRVRGVQVHGSTANEAVAGQRTALNLAGATTEDLARGMTLAPPETFQTTRRLDVELQLLKSAPRSVKYRTKVHFHSYTNEMVAEARPHSGKKEIAPGETRFARIVLPEPALFVPGDRFIIRQFSPVVTIGGGMVLDAAPISGLKEEIVETLLKHQAEGRAQEALSLRIARRGRKGLTMSQAISETGMTRAALDAELARLVQRHEVLRFADLLLDSSALRALTVLFPQALSRFHQANPLVPGIGKEMLRDQCGLSADVFNAVLDMLSCEKKVEVDGDLVRLPGRGVVMKDEEAESKKQIEDAFASAGLKVPFLNEVLAGLKLDKTRAQKIVTLLLRDKTLVKVSQELVFHRAALEDLRRQMATLKTKSRSIDVGKFKEMTGVSRKYAIPLLEYLDRERVTRRVGESREIL
ncbi:MAG TPA: selenocysteine-specific translation elongation factor [Candidatus Sulfotelmatobacter sp.]|nr:selenocysteine-specific translation elongation factor [Candidatus Sulfotelmatobacter sp.]